MMNVKSFLHGSRALIDMGEFSDKDIDENSKYTFVTYNFDTQTIGDIYVIGKGPKQDERTKRDDDCDLIVLTRLPAQVGSSYRKCSAFQSGYTGIRSPFCDYVDNSLFEISEDGQRAKISVNFGLLGFDIEDYVFRYFVFLNRSVNSFRQPPKGNSVDNFEYAIVNKLNGNFTPPYLSPIIGPYYYSGDSYPVSQFVFSQWDSYLSKSEYDYENSLLLASNYNSPVIFISYPSWLKTHYYEHPNSYTDVHSAYKCSKTKCETTTITEKTNIARRISIEETTGRSGDDTGVRCIGHSVNMTEFAGD